MSRSEPIDLTCDESDTEIGYDEDELDRLIRQVSIEFPNLPTREQVQLAREINAADCDLDEYLAIMGRRFIRRREAAFMAALAVDPRVEWVSYNREANKEN
jgi:hypothetical protein